MKLPSVHTRHEAVFLGAVGMIVSLYGRKMLMGYKGVKYLSEGGVFHAFRNREF